MNNPLKTELSVDEARNAYLISVTGARSANTARSYANALNVFMRVLKEHWVEPTSPVSGITEEAISWTLSYLKNYSSSTERLYAQAIKSFYEFLVAERIADINLPRLTMFIKHRSRKPGQRLPQFPRDEMEKVLDNAEKMSSNLPPHPNVRLREMRDRAFLLTLADTGLRVHEACNLRRGDLDWNEGRAIIIGKGNKQAVIRFSNRSMQAIKDYLSLRIQLDGSSGHPLPSLPLFARHDRGSGKKVKPITTATGRNIVKTRVRQFLGEEAQGHITPHSFRHFFVTTVLRASGNLKLAQELARHANIQVTQRYAHLSDDELDKGYHEIFEKK